MIQQGQYLRRVPVTGAYTCTLFDDVVECNAASGAFTVTLPDAGYAVGKRLTIKRTDASANLVTISPSIEGAIYYLATRYDFVSVYSNGSAWLVIENKITVSAQVYGATTTVGIGASPVIHPLKEYDPLGAYNTTTGAYLCLYNGLYRVTAESTGGSTTSSTLVDKGFYLGVGKNTSSSMTKAIATMKFQVTGTSVRPDISGSVEIQCSVNDLLYIVVSRDSQVTSFNLYGSDSINSYAIFTKIG
jgi:hypothetical protein